MPKTGKTPTFTLRVPADLRAKLEERAAAENRTLANYIVWKLTSHVIAERLGAHETPNDPLAALPAAKRALAADVDAHGRGKTKART